VLNAPSKPAEPICFEWPLAGKLGWPPGVLVGQTLISKAAASEKFQRASAFDGYYALYTLYSKKREFLAKEFDTLAAIAIQSK